MKLVSKKCFFACKNAQKHERLCVTVLDAFWSPFLVLFQCFFHRFFIEKAGKALVPSPLIELLRCVVKPVLRGTRRRHQSPWQSSTDYGLVNDNYRWQASFREHKQKSTKPNIELTSSSHRTHIESGARDSHRPRIEIISISL